MAYVDPDRPPGGARFLLEDDSVGERSFVVIGPWTRATEEAFLGAGTTTLVLNYARGFEADPGGSELEFLDRDLGVQRLRLLDRGVVDIAPIYRLSDSLMELSIQAAPSAELDLGELPNLRRVAGDWTLIGPSLEALTGLCEAITWRFDGRSLEPFQVHDRLQRLTVNDAPRLESLDGTADHSTLRYLEIRAAKCLDDLSTLSTLDLEDLRLERCRSISSIEPIAALHRIRFLEIGDCGDLPSVAPLQHLAALEKLYAWGSTRFIDGDLSALTRLAALTEVRLQDRRHYRPRVRELPTAVS